MKSATVTHWWDRGRARWRARPENKARSYDEYVGGKRRPPRISDGGERRSVRVALGQYAMLGRTDDERCDPWMDRLENAATERPRGAFHRWQHTSTRRDRIAQALRRRMGQLGRKYLNARPFELPRSILQWLWATRGGLVGFDDRRLWLLEACGRCLARGEVREGVWRADARVLVGDRAFLAAVPESERFVFAKQLVAGMERYRAQRGDAGLQRMLATLCADHGRYAKLYATEWAWRFEVFDAVPKYWMNTPGRTRTIVARARAVFASDPQLAQRFFAWMERHARAA